MITHGNKQISEIVYARKASEGGGAVRLTNIIRGAQVVFGGIGTNVKNWLYPPTRAAILAAFGQTDGKAVIKATNAYLNALASTDKTKATALAGFINEDPMLVCSLGLQPQGVEMPIRWVERTGLAYINTGIFVNAAYTEFEMDCDWVKYDNNRGAIISNFSAGNVGIGYELQTSGYVRHYFDGDILNTPSFANNVPHTIRSTYNIGTGDLRSVIDGTTYSAKKSQSGIATLPLLWMTDHRISTLSSKVRQANQRIIANGIEHKYLPMLRSNNEIGVMDMASDGTFTFYPNANTSGSFTIAYTLPDGTPWTPLNQTP